MIDEMVSTLGDEQKDDDTQRDWCNTEFDTSEDKIATVTDELAALEKGIRELDKMVAEATDTRKDEHALFVQTPAENNAALQLLDVAKNRMNKFYNPALYKEPERRELTEEERIYVNSGGADPRDAEEAAVAGTGIAGTGITAFTQMKMRTKSRDAPAPPPETAEAYTKKDSSGPTALIDKLKNDLEKDTQAAEIDEKQAQKDYEEMMADSANQRHTDSKSIVEKDGQKADLEGDLQAAKSAKKSAEGEMMALGEYIAKLHGSCDFLLQNFDARKEARANEIDALKKAKAVLSGADYSFLQTAPKTVVKGLSFLQK